MRFKSKLPSPPPLQEGAEPPEVDELLANIDEKYELVKSLTEALAKISEDLTTTAQILVDAQKYAQNLRQELKTVVFHAEMSDATKAEFNQFHTDIGNKMKVELRDQYERQRDEIDQLMTDYLMRFEASQSAFVQKHNIIFKDRVKKLKQNKGVWFSSKIFWLLFILIGFLLSSTVWFIGQTLTK